jgi:hypothetical protein
VSPRHANSKPQLRLQSSIIQKQPRYGIAFKQLAIGN